MNGISDDTSKINTYVGDDGLIHFTNKDGADTVLNFSKGNNITYIETISIFCIAVNYNGNNYNVFVSRNRYDPNGIGDQQLLNASGYYGSGWRISLTVSDKAIYRTNNSGMLANGDMFSYRNFICIAAM